MEENEEEALMNSVRVEGEYWEEGEEEKERGEETGPGRKVKKG